MVDAPERIWAGRWPHGGRAWRDAPAVHIKTEYIRADLVEALEAENQRLRDALQRAYDHVLRDAPDWFMRHSHEQQALEVERSAALSALRSTEGG